MRGQASIVRVEQREPPTFDAANFAARTLRNELHQINVLIQDWQDDIERLGIKREELERKIREASQAREALEQALELLQTR
jgi:hypothetical protein